MGLYFTRRNMMHALTRIFLCLTLCFAVCLAASPPTACKAKFLGCPPGTLTLEKGKDEQGCPIYVCKRPGCFVPECSPSEKLEKAMVEKIFEGCPLYICKKACPTTIIPECPACHSPIVNLDENRCLKLTCERVRCPKCPPNTHEIVVENRDPCGCPHILCHVDAKINTAGQEKMKKNKHGMKEMKPR